MQRRTSQTFQRLRKLSDTLVSAIVPASSAKSSGQDSFFEYGKKGWHAPPRTSTDSSYAHPPVHRRPSYRNGLRVSKEDIRYPLLSSSDQVEIVDAAEATARARGTARRPERPREEDLPYGAQGSVPKALAQSYVAPPPAVGSRRPREPASAQAHHQERQSSVPFPQSGSREQERERERAARVGGAHREKPLPEPPRDARPSARTHAQRPPANPAPASSSSSPAFYNLFASASAPPNKHAARAPAPGASTHVRDVYDPAPGTVEHPTRPERGRADPSARSSSRRQYARVRRISSSGDVHPPPHQARYHDENTPPRPAPELRPVRSTPLRVQETHARSPPPLPPAPRPLYPVSPQPFVHVAKPRPRNVPRDVSPEHNPQRLPTPRRSSEEVRACHDRWQQQHPAPVAGVAAQAQAALRVQQSVGPRPVRVVDATPEYSHAMSYKAQVVRPSRDQEREERRAERERQRAREQERERAQEREREREREREIERQRRHDRSQAHAHDMERRGRERLRPTHTRAVEVEYYGMSDAFTQEITIALTEPERAHPLPLDWRMGGAPSNDYGVRPLVTKKSRQMAGAM